MTTTQYQQSVDRFLKLLGEKKQRGALTIEHYRDYLERFGTLQHITSVASITEKKINEYKQQLADAGLSRTTRNYHLIALRGLLRSLPENRRPLAIDAVALYTTNYRPQPRIPKVEIQKLMDALGGDVDEKRLTTHRNRSIVELLHTTGIGLHELAHLKRTHVNFARRQLMVTRRPLSTRMLPLSHHASSYLQTYLRMRHDASPFLFVSHDHASGSRSRRVSTPKPISTRTLQRSIGMLAQKNSHHQITVRTLQQACKKRST